MNHYKATWEHSDGILTVRSNADKPHVAAWEPTGKRDADGPVAWTVEFDTNPAVAFEALAYRLDYRGGWQTEADFTAEVAALDPNSK